MGTNFYARKKLTKATRDELREFIRKEMPSQDDLYKMIEDGDIRTIKSRVEDFSYDLEQKVNEIISEVHLGKRSAGWQFLWQYYDGLYYNDNLQSIAQFLDNGEYEIFNEYGEKFTTEQFLNEQLKGYLYKDYKHCDIRQYYEEEPPTYNFMWNYCDREWQSADGLRFTKDEFC